MLRYILAPVMGGDADIPVLQGAAALARIAAAHLLFLHARPDLERLALPLTVGASGGDAALPEYMGALEQELTAREDRAKATVDAFCAAEGIVMSSDVAASGPTAEWRTATGDLPDCLVRFGRAADLLVLGRMLDDGAMPIDVLAGALLQIGRPLVVVPEPVPAQLGQVVAIAWKDTTEAAHAVTAALPLLEAAGRVVILSVTEQVNADQAACERLRQALVWHNLATTVQHLALEGMAPAERLLMGVADIGADLLVMGGYGHSRMREMVFGGFTRRVLQAADLPVLMAH